MGSMSIRGAICLIFLVALVAEIRADDFDVKNYGAKGDGKSDDNQAMMRAWREACASEEASKVVISKGSYRVGPVKFQGPCKAPITIQNEATWVSPTDLKKLKSQDGWIIFQNVVGLTLSGGTYDGQGEVAWSQNDCSKTGKCNSLPINIRFTQVSNSMIRDITSLDSKLFHMNILNCNNLTLQNVKINAPESSLNTDGIHIGRSNGVHILGANIKTGDDCVSLGDGSKQVIVEKVTCGPGHGISVGSLGKYQNEEPVVGVTVRNCTFLNTMNGVRVKTWPASPNGVARDMHFENLVMDNVGHPVLIDQQYCPYGQCQDKIPSKVKISDVSFKGIRGTSSTKVAVKIVCSKGIPCQNVQMSEIHLTYNGNDGSATSECANVQPAISGHLFPPACAAQPSA